MVKFEFSLSKQDDIDIWLEFIKNPNSDYGINWLKGYSTNFKKNVTNKSKKELKEFIDKHISKYYTKKYTDNFFKNKEKLNKHKTKIIKRLEKIHNKKFPVNKVIVKYNTFIACPYEYFENKDYFCIYLSKRYINKGVIGITIHELMHLFFEKYFWKYCKSKKLNEEQINFIRESFTVIINKEFSDILDHKDYGYPNHKNLRKFIKKEWKNKKSFKEILEYVCENFNKLK